MLLGLIAKRLDFLLIEQLALREPLDVFVEVAYLFP
jgi:hypothetical protein